MKKWLVVALCVALVAALAGCGGDKKAAAPKTDAPKAKVLRVGHTLTDDSHYGVGLKKFAELVKAKSKGSLDVQVFGNSKLGNERDLIEGVSLGTVEMALSSTGPLPSFSKKFMVFDLPFIVQDRAKFYPILDGKVGQDMLDSLGSKGIKGLVFFENGFRHMTNSKRPINKPEDMAGLKMRLMENPVHMETFKVLGANPSPMPFGELFTALQQNVIDGQENPYPVFASNKFEEVQKYITEIHYKLWIGPIAINADWLEKLPPEQKKAVLDAGKYATKRNREMIAAMDAELKAHIAKAGVQIIDKPEDESVWAEKAMTVWPQFYDKIGDLSLLDNVLKSLGKTKP